MIRNRFKNPIEREGIEIEFTKYVEMHKEQQYSTNPKRIEQLKRSFYNAHPQVSEQNLDKAWNFVAPKLTNDIGLLEFIKDYCGHKSEFFFPWLINVFKSPATALEISYGAGPDLNGDWHEDIMETDDPIVPFIKDDPAFVYNRERQLLVADLAASVQSLAYIRCSLAKIVDFGAGRLAWYRRYNFEDMFTRPTVYAFDKDPSIDPKKLFPDDLEKLGIFYKRGDFVKNLTNPNCKDADLVILGGVASYIPPADFAGKIVGAIHRLLRRGGVFFYDLQLDCPCYQHSMDILDWPKFEIPANASEIIDRTESMLRALRLNGIDFSAEYHVDSQNQIPSAVMIVLQKLS